MTIVPVETLKKIVLRFVNTLRDEFGNYNLKLLIEINRLKTFQVLHLMYLKYMFSFEKNLKQT